MIKSIIESAAKNEIPEQSSEMLDRIDPIFGAVPHLFHTAAHSSAALESLWSQLVAAGKQRLSARLRGAIGLRVSQLNGCCDPLTIHTAPSGCSDVDPASEMEFRQGRSNDPKEQVLLALVTKIMKDCGHHAGFVVETARKMGVSEAEIVEVIALISLHTFTDYLQAVAPAGLSQPEPLSRSSCSHD